MNLPIFMRVKNYTKFHALFLLTIFLVSELGLAWSIDLSRRRKDMRRREASIHTDSAGPSATDMLNQVVPVQPKQEIVILNTEKGFVPDTLRLVQGQRYKVHVVNINPDSKNNSFIMDYFGEHHGTFYGEKKTFVLNTDKEGIYSYQCPELAFEGRLVVTANPNMQNKSYQPQKGPNPLGSKTIRGLASEKK